MLTFHESAHQYFWNDKPVINVTRVLEPLCDYSMIPAATLETAQQKGVAVHKMVELDCKGEIDEGDENSLPAWMRPALVQWRKFVVDCNFEMLESERRVFHPTYHYAGTLDLLGLMHGEYALIDIKRSFYAGPVIGLQTAAYLDAYGTVEKGTKKAKRYALRLNETGPYRLEPFEDKSDFGTFLALLTIQRWRERHQ